MKNKNVEILNSLYQNASMGVSSLQKIIPKVKDKNLKNQLLNQLDTYSKQKDKLVNEIYSYDATPKDINAYAKTSAEIGISMNTMLSSSPSHIAQMMIQGTDMGVIDINKTLNDYTGVEQSVLKRAKDILTDEQKYIDNLKKYL